MFCSAVSLLRGCCVLGGPSGTRSNQIYVAYSVYDAAAVNRLVSELETRGFVVLLEENGLRNPTLAGRSHRFTDQALVEGARFFVYVLSKDSMKSTVALEAYRHALRSKKEIVPFLLEAPRALEAHMPPDILALVSRTAKLFIVDAAHKMTAVQLTAERLGDHLVETVRREREH
eukprot:tig00021126_g18474.t1